MLIVVAGMIGAGKTSLTKIISEEFGGLAYFEEADSEILNKFYTAPEEEAQAKRYPFLLQLEFLCSRYSMIKKCLVEGDNPRVNVLDRSIYEDEYFMEINHRLGRISEMEAYLYRRLLHNMLEEIEYLPKKAPDVCIYLSGSFNTFIDRIIARNRNFEKLDEKTESYFYSLWESYDKWIEESYKASPVITIDIDKIDFVNNPKDKEYVLKLIRESLIAQAAI